jgi:hypothetical protein
MLLLMLTWRRINARTLRHPRPVTGWPPVLSRPGFAEGKRASPLAFLAMLADL